MTHDFVPSKAGGDRMRLSKEEYAAKKQAEKEQIYQMIDDTVTDLMRHPEKFPDFLDTQSRMDRYSAANALLIYRQLPHAKQLKDFDDWGKEQVKITKGAKSIAILEPVEYTKADGTPGISYHVKKVFDISQTNGKQLPSPSMDQDPKELITVMLDASPVSVEAVDELPYPDTAAFYDNDRQTLFVKRGVGDSVTVAQSIAQELAYAQLSIHSDVYSRNALSFSAICVGYMLCKKYGVDTKRFPVNHIPDDWIGKESRAFRGELTKMRNALSDIHTRVSEEMYRKKKARSKDYER